MWAAIKGNWAQIMVAIGLLATGFNAYFGWQVDKAVAAKFKEENIVSKSTVDANTESIEDLEKDLEKIDLKIERVVQILIEE